MTDKVQYAPGVPHCTLPAMKASAFMSLLWGR